MVELYSIHKNDIEILTTLNFETVQAIEDSVQGNVIIPNSAKELLSIL
jgi:hypothetical protein